MDFLRIRSTSRERHLAERVMIEDDFDSRTVANMTVALERICGTLPDGEDHAVRARVAEAILTCAREGRRALGDFEAAGRRVLRRPPEEAPGAD